MANSLFVTCDCGKPIPVTAGMAGSQVTCECGLSTQVPTLRHLAQGREMVESSDPLVAIRSCLEHGQPPAGTSCLVCHEATENCITCELDGWQSGWEDPAAPWITRWLRRTLGRGPRPTTAADSAPIVIPIRLCAACFRRSGDLRNASVLRKIADRSALFRQVYSAYPRATLRYRS